MSYQILIPKSVQKQIDRIPNQDYEKIYNKIKLLAENPRPLGAVKLKGYDNQYRIRIGDYRVRYKIEDEELIVLIVNCNHRKDVYRDK